MEKFYICKKCGNVLYKLVDSGAPIMCCNEEMSLLNANITDAATEKHLPVVKKIDDELLVSVGSTIHPMTKEHYIMWIAAVFNDRISIVRLYPEQDPIIHLPYFAKGNVYAFCNLHGLWRTPIK